MLFTLVAPDTSLHEFPGTDTPYSSSTWPPHPHPAVNTADGRSVGLLDGPGHSDEGQPPHSSTASSTFDKSRISSRVSSKNETDINAQTFAPTKPRSNSVVSAATTSGSLVEDLSLYEEVDISLPGEKGAPGKCFFTIFVFKMIMTACCLTDLLSYVGQRQTSIP